MIRILGRFQYYAEMLSLDVCIGAMGSGAVAQAIYRSRMKAAWWWILPLSVWVIYTADHLFDAWKLRGNAVNARHKFHHDHFTLLACLAAIAALVSFLGALYYLRDLVVLGGLLVGAFALLHIVLAFWGRVRIGKELSVAVIYTFGVWYAPVANRSTELNVFSVAAVVVFAVAALQNLFMNSIIEYDLDHAEGQTFAAAVLPHHALRHFILGISALAAFAIPVLWLLPSVHSGLTVSLRAAASFILFLAVVPGAILLLQKFAFFRANYRVFAEWVFALGLGLLFLSPQF